MKEELFEELLTSVREAGSILRSESEPSREFSFDEPDVIAIRMRLGLSQAKFAELLGISLRTLQNWEQGRRKPRGPTRVLLMVAAHHPETLLDIASQH